MSCQVFANHLFAGIIIITLCIPSSTADEEDHLYSNAWAVHIKGGLHRAKRLAEDHGFIFGDEILKDHYTLHHEEVSKRSISASSRHHNILDNHPEVLWTEQQRIKRRVKRDYNTFSLNDPLYKNQWYLSRSNGDRRMLDMNLLPAWKQGYTGRGVVVTILDDGIERDHPDLKQNYDSRASKDINSGDSDPMPRYEHTNENRHGTRCAGEVAAAANNSVCGTGVAYQANIGGIRMLDGDVTDSVEALSLSYNRDHIDIYSASWGPDDDGRTVDGPGSLARRAFREGVTLGRRGKGSIFVWASGNGGRDKDSCNCDGYTNSIYTLSISSATENGNVPWYSEACSSTLATTYSSGNAFERQIVTTDLRKMCTEEHTGTSASAPLAAGISALVLQANPMLTWRDMQHLVVMSANPHNLHADDWVVNGVGRRVSHHFGYGIMNAGKMVELAKNWTNVPQQRVCEIVSSQRNQYIPPQDKIVIRLYTDGCGGTSNNVVYLEHVQAKISLTSSFRGDVVIWLTSPMGTKSSLLTARVNDNNNKGFNEWEFMTTHSWGEFAKGEWILEIENGYRASKAAQLKDWNLILFGTKTDPLMQTDRRSSENVRKIKQRDHDPSEGGDGLTSDVVDSIARSGIIMPDLQWMMRHNRPKPYKAPVYKPSDRPSFEYVNSGQRNKPASSGFGNSGYKPSSGGGGGSGGNRLAPVVFNHGDHQHRIGHDGLLEDIIIGTDTDKESSSEGRQHYNNDNHAATLKDFSLVLHGTETSPYDKTNHPLLLSDVLRTCPDTEVLYKDHCVRVCPHGWYRRRSACYPCHVSCAACVSAKNNSCTECYYGSYLQDGICLPLGEGVKINAGASLDEDIPPDTLWWLMVGATIAVCMLVIFLVLLAIYYAYTQRYLCTNSESDPDEGSETSRSASMNTESTSDSLTVKPPDGCHGENIRLTSQNSSQQELMSASEDEAEAYHESHRLRRGANIYPHPHHQQYRHHQIIV